MLVVRICMNYAIAYAVFLYVTLFFFFCNIWSLDMNILH